MTDILIVPVLQDNYCYVLHHDSHVFAVDPGESAPVRAFLESRNWPLHTILLTHHHGDHMGGAEDLKAVYSCRIIGPLAEKARMPIIDQGVEDGEIITINGLTIHTIATPGHTSSHCVYWIPSLRTLFSGDTLFSLGCGRLFEGTAEQMYKSLRTISELPDDTLIYCGHEYTEANGRFALSVDPRNPDLIARMEEVRRLRQNDTPTLPVTLAMEKKTNPFLRTGSAGDFALLRHRKDSYG